MYFAVKKSDARPFHMKMIMTLAVTSLLALPAWTQSQPGTNKMNPEIAEMLSTNPPPKGFANWSLRLLAEKAVALEIVESVSHETVRRTLKKTV